MKKVINTFICQYSCVTAMDAAVDFFQSTVNDDITSEDICCDGSLYWVDDKEIVISEIDPMVFRVEELVKWRNTQCKSQG